MARSPVMDKGCSTVAVRVATKSGIYVCGNAAKKTRQASIANMPLSFACAMTAGKRVCLVVRATANRQQKRSGLMEL